MRIAVLIKQVPNPDALAAVMRVDERACRIELPPGHPLVASPFDEQALEAALRLRDQRGAEVKISAITLGPDSAKAVLKQALALGADDAVHIQDAALSEPDSHTSAHALAAAVRKLGGVDLVLTGRQAADRDAGVVALGVAEILQLPAVTFACAIEAAAGALRVDRVLPDGIETVEVALPALVTVSNELGAVRKPNLRETMRAARKPIALWSAADLALAPAQLVAKAMRTGLFVPRKTAQCEVIEGATPAERGAALARRLHAAGLI
ncbi:MAG: electron transfer flavoprotein subunit beta/FixA family protein [Burkholderiales bacterium]|nr:electron transfer flavoprotein subunit beta/FixA family protein [Burkholderiales bacterium]